MEWQTKIWEMAAASGLPCLLLAVSNVVTWRQWMAERKEHKAELASAQAETKAANASRIQDLHELLKPQND